MAATSVETDDAAIDVGDFDAFAARVGLRREPFHRRLTAARGPESELLVLLPRGNGKTALVAALAVDHLLTVPRPAVYVARRAAPRKHAATAFACSDRRDGGSRTSPAHAGRRAGGRDAERRVDLPGFPSGHTSLGVTSIYLQGIDSAEIIDAVHARRAPMIPVDTSLRLRAPLPVLVQGG